MNYTIGFKSGARIEIDVIDGKDFVEGIRAGIEQNNSASAQWYSEPGLIFVVSELEFILPSSMDRYQTNQEKPKI